eukprot:TRINITY_DN346_c0_g1_i2.p1 TRINITY_DN346_c0_g1~~TRINITY_DN346_c0_g1_i2.p1  ORF type:complete len:201 (-),score=55.67 TRINITY_DN346_c0_g1_i2:153-755(-)
MANENHCIYCFDVLLKSLKKKNTTPQQNFEDRKCPLFVTWNKFEDHDEEPRLRGCIGTFSHIQLSEGLNKYTKISAFKDKRFNPIEPEEVEDLQCSVSLLTDFEEVEDVYDWEVGTHGVLIEFACENSDNTYSATYLPEVASSQNWTKEETLRSLVKKSGYKLSRNHGIPDNIRLTRYMSSKHKLTYDQYLEYKNNNNEN